MKQTCLKLMSIKETLRTTKELMVPYEEMATDPQGRNQVASVLNLIDKRYVNRKIQKLP